MKVILLKSVSKIGKVGDIVEVSDGFATNALFPNKSAIAATMKNIEDLNRKKQSKEHSRMLQHELLERAIATLPNITIEIQVKANEKGHLFSKIDIPQIVEALQGYHVSISPKNIFLPEIIKNVGIYKIRVQEGTFKTFITVIVKK